MAAGQCFKVRAVDHILLVPFARELIVVAIAHREFPQPLAGLDLHLRRAQGVNGVDRRGDLGGGRQFGGVDNRLKRVGVTLQSAPDMLGPDEIHIAPAGPQPFEGAATHPVRAVLFLNEHQRRKGIVHIGLDQPSPNRFTPFSPL